jgi:hypothetical protein
MEILEEYKNGDILRMYVLSCGDSIRIKHIENVHLTTFNYVPYSFVRLPVHSYPPPQVEDYASVY